MMLQLKNLHEFLSWSVRDSKRKGSLFKHRYHEIIHVHVTQYMTFEEANSKINYSYGALPRDVLRMQVN